MNEESLADAIDALLPQTQCTRCGYPACRPYAQAVAGRSADINRCPPGGELLIGRLADLLQVLPKPLDPACGVEQQRCVAVIDEAWCIGCTLCIQVCPVDAVLGSGKLMHTVISEACTGCELCLSPCPTDCIAMQPVDAFPVELRPRLEWGPGPADRARRRYRARQRRLTALRRQRAEGAGGRRARLRRASLAVKKLTIEKAVERARARRAVSRSV